MEHNREEILEFFSFDEEKALQLWRINKFKVEPQVIGQMQTFFTGDCYILLSKRHNQIHFWLGETATVDELTCAAILAVKLDAI